MKSLIFLSIYVYSKRILTWVGINQIVLFRGADKMSSDKPLKDGVRALESSYKDVLHGMIINSY